MTLKEKFNDIIGQCMPIDWENQCEILADKYAVEFAEWLLKNYDGIKSVKELLEIYKKEKGL
jgi:hypothetical protein